MRNILFLVTILFVCAPVGAQQPIRSLPSAESCAFNGPLPLQNIYAFESDNEAKTAVNAVMRHTGLPANFTILAGDVPNAAAVIYENTRYIVYNQSFMLAIRDLTKTNWSLVSILVHEIGHHLSGHTLNGSGNRLDKELEADRFSGFILYKMGATLEQAKVAMEKVGTETGTATHPPKSARLAAITNGWLAAKDLAVGTVPKPIYKGGDRASTLSNQATEASADFSDLHVDTKATQHGQKGLLVRARLKTQHLKGQKCLVSAWFYDAYGKPLRDHNQKYATSSGWVATSTVATPTKATDAFNEVSIFIPYEELHTLPGKQTLKVNLGLHNGSIAVGMGSAYHSFVIE